MDVTYYRSNQDVTKQGIFQGFDCNEIRTTLFLDIGNEEGIYVSDVFDSGQHSMEWDELHLHMEGKYQICVYLWIFNDHRYREQLLQTNLANRFHMLKKYGELHTHKDILLYNNAKEQKGRYLCFGFQIQKMYYEKMHYQGYEVSYPSQKFTSYLPALYQSNQELEAYLSVFKNLYLKLETEIDEFYKELDFHSCKEEHIKELLSWIGLERFSEYTSAAKLRDLPKLYWTLAPMKDSIMYFKEMVQFLFDKEVILYEKNEELWIYMTIPRREDAIHIDRFFQQELPVHIRYHLQYVQDVQMDDNAFFDITSMFKNIPSNEGCLNCNTRLL